MGIGPVQCTGGARAVPGRRGQGSVGGAKLQSAGPELAAPAEGQPKMAHQGDGGGDGAIIRGCVKVLPLVACM